MRWQGRRQSGNVEDRRRSGGRGLAIGGGIGGVGGIIVLVLYLLLGGNPTEVTQSLQGEGAVAPTEAGELSQEQREMGEFGSVVLADIEEVWNEQFRQLGPFCELDAPGDFALAYVIAHEVGHHVQNLLGVMEEVSTRQARLGEREANQLTVRLELQADFLAGVWAHYARRSSDFLDSADIEEGINAAGAVGDGRNRPCGCFVGIAGHLD